MEAMLRHVFTRSDSYGIDPLRDTSTSIVKLKASKNHPVTVDERGRPDLISYREYGTCDLWWVILTYNKIFNHRDLTEGVVLSLPSYQSVMTLLNSLVSYDTKSSQQLAKTVEI
jgi:hypothetical protein